ncbi:hypothetical protein ABZU76_13830 [Amycolatopsis sp. NPDC005232]|uniref:hypothetical protein n=1 Tax=Amycolatopsis sp. NPDC005232 TaxID=3157027 RepID=UPI0033A536C4
MPEYRAVQHDGQQYRRNTTRGLDVVGGVRDDPRPGVRRWSFVDGIWPEARSDATGHCLATRSRPLLPG